MRLYRNRTNKKNYKLYWHVRFRLPNPKTGRLKTYTRSTGTAQYTVALERAIAIVEQAERGDNIIRHPNCYAKIEPFLEEYLLTLPGLKDRFKARNSLRIALKPWHYLRQIEKTALRTHFKELLAYLPYLEVETHARRAIAFFEFLRASKHWDLRPDSVISLRKLWKLTPSCEVGLAAFERLVNSVPFHRGARYILALQACVNSQADWNDLRHQPVDFKNGTIRGRPLTKKMLRVMAELGGVMTEKPLREVVIKDFTRAGIGGAIPRRNCYRTILKGILGAANTSAPILQAIDGPVPKNKLQAVRNAYERVIGHLEPRTKVVFPRPYEINLQGSKALTVYPGV